MAEKKKWYDQTLGEWYNSTLKPAIGTAVNATKKYNQQVSAPVKTQPASSPQGQSYKGNNYTNIGTWEAPAVSGGHNEQKNSPVYNLAGDYDYLKGTGLSGKVDMPVAKKNEEVSGDGAGGVITGYLGGGGGYNPYPSYVSPYGDQLQAALDKLINREEFSYDYLNDPIYQQYAKQYGIQGDMARQDTLGDVASMTGGMPSSWAVSAAQQAQNSWNSGLNDIIPSLQEAAYQKYLGNYEADANLASLLSSLDGMAYERYNQDRNYDLAIQEANNRVRKAVSGVSGGSGATNGVALSDMLGSGMDGTDWVAANAKNLTDEQLDYILEYLNNNASGGLLG